MTAIFKVDENEPEDWLLKLTATRVHTVNAYMYHRLDLDDKIFNR